MSPCIGCGRCKRVRHCLDCGEPLVGLACPLCGKDYAGIEVSKVP
jgi:hypothetical protein